MQAQTDKADLNAQKDVSVQSTAASVLASAPKHQLLTAQGAYIRLEGGNIQVHAPGSVTFHSGQKNWTGAAKVAAAAVNLPVASELHLQPIGPLSIRPAAHGCDDMAVQAGWAGRNYTIYSADGTALAKGIVGADGRLERINAPRYERLVVELGDPNRSDFVPIAVTSLPDEDVDDDASDDEAGPDAEDSSWDDPAQVTPAALSFKGSKADHKLPDAYLGEKVVQKLLEQLEIDLNSDDNT